MAEDIKSSLHDAVPSWNGFNYQGKVGLYVCLKNIVEKLNDIEINSTEFNNFLNSYSIEYEWIEDFSIKNDESYISLHQVKHKEGTSFSNHISAVVTILNRKLCRLSETDFIKYIKLDYDYSDCINDEEKKTKKYSIIKNKIDEIRQAGYLDAEYTLAREWKSIESEIEDVDKSELEKLLSDFESFSDNTFMSSKVYFHTSEKVTSPRNDLDLYQGMPDHHKSKVRGLKSLSSLDIFLGFDSQSDYDLEMNDQEIEIKLNDLILEILKKTQPEETFISDQISLYQALLLRIIDLHVAQRHKNIREKKEQGNGFLETREGIKFSAIIDPLMTLFAKQDLKYWEGFCMKIFQDAYAEEIEKIEYMINNDINSEQNEKKKIKLEAYRSTVFNHEISEYLELLIQLSPHIRKRNGCVYFYNEIANKESIKDTYLYFIQSIDFDYSNFIIDKSERLKMYPSMISFATKQKEEWEYHVRRCQLEIQENNFSFLGATHLVVKTANEHEITNRLIKLNTLIENIHELVDVKYKNEITNIDNVRFMSIDDAVKEINNG